MGRIIVDPQPTPNPNAMKFTVNVKVTEGGSESYSSPEKAESSPVAKAIFALGGVTNVFMLGNFVTVNKKDDSTWNDLAPDIVEAIENGLSE